MIITLSDKADIHLFKERGRSLLRSKIIKTLKSKADLTQRPLKIFLQNRAAKRIIPLWIINGIAATLRAEAVRELESLPGIEEIRLDAIIQAPVTAYDGTSTLPG